jgi:hypothetical protein
VEWVERLHVWLSYLLIGLVCAHVAGVVFTSIRQRENLVAAMLHGRKRPLAAAGADAPGSEVRVGSVGPASDAAAGR